MEPVAEAASAPVVEPVAEPVASAQVEAVAEVASAVEAKTEVEEKEETPELKRPVSDAEVLAALASLTPAGGEFVVAAQQAETASFTGPRWIAEAVAVGEEESTTLLEHEMEKAFAAFAAADAGRLLLAAPVQAVMPGNGNGHSAERAEAENAVATEAVASIPQEAAYAAAATAGAIEQPVASASSSVQVNEPEEGSRVREAELAAAWANWRNIRESILGEPTSAPVEPVIQESSPPAETIAPAEPVTEPVIDAVSEPVAEVVPEAAAAVAPEEQQEAAAPAVEEVKAEVPEPEPAPAERDSSEISNIVDNMLAELKPKLMEELKRKLGK
jgi:hypothetical protein